MRNTTSFILFVVGITICLFNPLLAQQQQQDRVRYMELRSSLNNQASLGEYANAVKIATKMMEIDDQDFGPYLVRGEMNYMIGDMEASVADFDKVIEMRPDAKARLWQRGLALYYLERFDEAIDQFEVHRTINGQDVENAVWHFACQAKATNFQKAREQLMPITSDSRVPMMQIHQLYAGTMSPQDVLDAATKAGANEQAIARNKFYANFYIGLYYEAKGDAAKSMEHMKMATEDNNYMPKRALMGQVGNVHLKMRDEKDDSDSDK